jgi:hypothetical protein
MTGLDHEAAPKNAEETWGVLLDWVCKSGFPEAGTFMSIFRGTLYRWGHAQCD